MDPIKEAFSRIKEDISLLFQEIQNLKSDIEQIQLQQNPYSNPTIQTDNPTQPPTPTDTPTQTPTLPYEIRGLSQPNLGISTGNGGVPTDKPTDRQTNQQTDIREQKFAQSIKTDPINEFVKAQDILDSLDAIKKEIRLKFKRLTPQEMLVFSTLYSLEEQNISQDDGITYKLIANNLNLSESSIRDYVNKLIAKGVPVLKIRRNNKKIALSISPDLKNIATLSTINKLRDL